MARRWPLVLVALQVSCAQTPPPVSNAASAGAPLNQTSAPVTSPPAAPPPPAASAPAPAPEPTPEERFAGSSFPPAAFEPMHERTAKPEDGAWTPMPELPGGVAYVATVHPHPIKKWVEVTLVAFDRRLVDLALVAGTQEPDPDAPEDKRTGLVPEAHHDDLLVVFNGGFKAQHGRYGMMLDGHLFVKPKDDACVLAFGAGGELTIAPWPDVAARADAMTAWRQTPPCLIEAGVKNERLKSEFRSRKWGAAAGGDRDIRRSAIGLDASGRTLFYAFGEWVSASELTDGMIRAGVHDAAELDINWSYTRFYWFDHPAGEAPKIGGSIIPKAEYAPRRYIEKASYRDFFYLRRHRR